jgi:hypothetical protein
MAKATITHRASLQYKSTIADWFAATQRLFNLIAAFYFEVIQAHEGVLDLPTKEALTALEKLTHATKKNPHPIMPLAELAPHCPAMFRRAAIHKEVARYAAGQPAEGSTPGAPLVLCPDCGMKGHADRNASLVIGKRLVARYQTPTQEKPPTPLATERESQDSGGEDSQEPETEAVGHSSLLERHGILTGHGTAQNRSSRMVEPVREITNSLRPQSSRSHAPSARGSADVGVSEAPGREPRGSVTKDTDKDRDQNLTPI